MPVRHCTFFIHSQSAAGCRLKGTRKSVWKQLCRSATQIDTKGGKVGIWIDGLSWQIAMKSHALLANSLPSYGVVFDSVWHIASWNGCNKSCTFWLKECFDFKREREYFFIVLWYFTLRNTSVIVLNILGSIQTSDSDITK